MGCQLAGRGAKEMATRDGLLGLRGHPVGCRKGRGVATAACRARSYSGGAKPAGSRAQSASSVSELLRTRAAAESRAKRAAQPEDRLCERR